MNFVKVLIPSAVAGGHHPWAAGASPLSLRRWAGLLICPDISMCHLDQDRFPPTSLYHTVSFM